MEQPKIIINTTMSKEDYRRFLYIATFRRNKLIIPLLCVMALIGSVIISFEGGRINFIMLIISWILLLALTVIIILFKVERKNSQRVKTDRTGTFDSINTLRFYEDRIIMENKQLKSIGELKYNQFFAVMESREYFIFYLTYNQASLIRKKDVDDLCELRELIIQNFKDKYKQI